MSITSITGVVVKNNNDLMDEFKEVLSNKNIQKAYQLIFDLFSDLKKELKNGNHKTISYASLYHGYLDMTYLPVTTEMLNNNGLKIAVVFNYSLFQFEIWLSAINRQKRIEVLEMISKRQWKKYKTVQNNGNPDAIIEKVLKGVNDFNNKQNIVSRIAKEVFTFIDDIEAFI